MRVAIVALALAFLVLGPLAGSAAAASPVRENFATAVAGTFKTDCPVGADRCTDTSILLFVDGPCGASVPRHLHLQPLDRAPRV